MSGGGRKGSVGGSLIPNFSKGTKIFLTKILLVQIQKKKKTKTLINFEITKI